MKSISLKNLTYRKRLGLLLGLLLTGLLVTLPVLAEDPAYLLVNTFGPRFGPDGSVQITNNSEITPAAVAVQRDGKSVVVGTKNDDFWVARYLIDGSPDSGFGNGGEMILPLGGKQQANGVGIDAKGKIVVVGENNEEDFAVARFNPNGGLDTTFSGGGFRTIDFAGTDRAYAVAFQPDGKILVGGIEFRFCLLCGEASRKFALARLTVTGQQDNLFDNDGKITTAFKNDFALDHDAHFQSLSIQTNSKIVEIGYDPFYDKTLIARRDLETGQLDRSFDGDGKVVSSAVGVLHDGLVQPDHKIVVIGFDNNDNYRMARFTTNGQIDLSFGDNGIRVLNTPDGKIYPSKIMLQPNGQIVVAGGKNSEEGGDSLIVAAYTTNGQPDPAFGDRDGYITLNLPGTENLIDMTQTTDGRLVLLRKAGNNYYLSRLFPDGSQDRGGRVVMTSPPSDFKRFLDVAVQPDGKIVAAGDYELQNRGITMSVTRFDRNGHIDTDFGNNGVGHDYGYGVGSAVAIDAHNRKLVAGHMHVYNGSNYDFYVQRYLSDGTPDHSFGDFPTRNFVAIDLGHHEERVNDMQLQADGKILVAGRSLNDAGLVRLLPDGQRDTDFGLNGKIVAHFNNRDSFEAIAVQPDGKIIAVGYTEVGDDFRILVARYLADGTLDLTFGNQGHVIHDHGNATDVTLLPNGNILASGYVLANNYYQFTVLQLNEQGELAGNFHAALVDFGESAGAYDIAIDTDDTILLVGCTLGPNSRVAVARLTLTGEMDPNFSSDGKATIDLSNRKNCAYGLGRDPNTGDYLLAGFATSGSFDTGATLARLRGNGVNNDPPLAVSDSYHTGVDTLLSVAASGLLSNDSDSDGPRLAAELVTPPNNGTLTITGDGAFTYIPNTSFNGLDSFTYRVSDSFVSSEPVRVEIRVSDTIPDPTPEPTSEPTPEPTPNPDPGNNLIFLPVVVK